MASPGDPLPGPPPPAWHNAVAGAVAGAGSRMAVAPLDLIRIRRQLAHQELVNQNLFQSFKTVVEREGGVTALFRGNVAAMYLWCGYMAVQFFVYGKATAFVERTLGGRKQYPNTTAFISGAIAGLAATLCTYPMDVCRSTFAAQGLVQQSASLAKSVLPGALPPKTIYGFAVQLLRQKGLKGFFAGSSLASVEIVPYMGLNFLVFEALTNDNRSVGLSGFAGSISGAVSKIAVYPLDTIKRRLQVQAFYSGGGGANPSAVAAVSAAAESTYYAGAIDCAKKIAAEEGLSGFYRGVVPSVLKATISSALCFGFYRFAKNVLETLSKKHSDYYYYSRSNSYTFSHRRHSRLQE